MVSSFGESFCGHNLTDPLPDNLRVEMEKFRTENILEQVKKRTALFSSRFKTADGKVGVARRWPEKNGRLDTGLDPRSFPRPAPPYPDPLPCMGANLGERFYLDGFQYGSAEQPQFGPVVPNTPFHVSSVMTRARLGQLSLCAATSNSIPGYPPQQALFFGAEGTHISGTIGHSFYLPNLPTSGIQTLQASTTLFADHVRDAVTTGVGGDLAGAGVYGFATLTVALGLVSITSKASSSVQFLDKELTTTGATDISLFDDRKYLQLATYLKYDGNSTVVFVFVDFEIWCANLLAAAVGADASQKAAVDLRFADNDSLKIYEDGVPRTVDPKYSCPLQVQLISLCGL